MIEHDSTCMPRSQRPVGDRSPTCSGWLTEPKTTSPLGSRAMMVPTHTTRFPHRRAGTIASSMLRLRFADHTPGNNRETSSNPLSLLRAGGETGSNMQMMLVSSEKDREMEPASKGGGW